MGTIFLINIFKLICWLIINALHKILCYRFESNFETLVILHILITENRFNNITPIFKFY